MTTYITDTEAVSAALHAAEGKARTRTITTAELQKVVAAAEDALHKMGITQKQQRDVDITVNLHINRHPIVKTYGYTAAATQVVVRRNSVGWYVESVSRRAALYYTIANERDFFFTIPASLKEDVTNRLLQNAGVKFTA